MNILVTGGAGYVGSVLIPELIKHGHFVKCLDRFFFGSDYLSQKKFSKKIQLIKDDIRWFEPRIFEDVNTVLDLAALSNDPAGDLNPVKTFEINHKGRVRVAKLAKENGVKRYILASSASIYGQQDKIATENSQVHPLTAYSKANREAEIENLLLNDKNFTVVVLRFSSLYGLSPRMRFDTAVNNMVLDLFKKGKILVYGKSNKRPFLHVKDAVNAYILIINAEKEKISGEIFNVGSENQNYEMGKLANDVASAINTKSEVELSDTNDHRSYFASSQKISEILGFVPKYTVKDGCIEMFEALKNGTVKETTKTKTVEWYKKLLSDKILEKEHSINGIII